MDKEIRQAIEQTKEQLPVEIDLKWYHGVIKLDEVKQYIRANINSASRSFIAIGYYLKYIRDKQLYKQDGYSGISEFAKAEFGISAGQASKFMSINDRFSVDGNSPILLDRYREFSSSKLSEMLYLTDEQLEQVTLATTVAEIREIKEPEQGASFSTSKTEAVSDTYATSHKEQEPAKEYKPCKFGGGKCNLFTDPGVCSSKARCCSNLITESEQEPNPKITEDEFVIAFYRHMYDSEKQLAHDKNSEQLRAELIKNHGKRYSNTNCILDGWTSCYPDKVVFRQNGNRTDQMQLSWGKVVSRLLKLIDEGRIVIPKPVDEDVNDTSENVDYEQEIVTDVDETVDNESDIVDETPENVIKTAESVIEEPENVITDRSCANCMYDTMNPDEYRRMHLTDKAEFPCNSCDDKLDHWEQKVEGLVLDCYNEEEGWHKEIISHEPDSVETVQADIIQTEANYALTAKHLLRSHENKLNDYIRVDMGKDLIEHQQVYIAALKAYIENTPKPTQEQAQPELPILKNNDQRKDFIEAYETWPIWIDQKETGERYYRYDFTNGDSFVIKVYWCSYYHYDYDLRKYIDEERYSYQEEYLLKPGKHFKNCQTNTTALVDYLKNFQKKGA